MRHFIKSIFNSTILSFIGFCLIGNIQVAKGQSLEGQLQGEIRETGMMNVVCATCNNPLGQVAFNQLSASHFDHIIYSHTLIKDRNIYRCEICKTPLFEISDLVYSTKDKLTFSKPLNLLQLKYETYRIALPPIAKRLCSFCRDVSSQNEFYEPGIVLKLR